MATCSREEKRSTIEEVRDGVPSHAEKRHHKRWRKARDDSSMKIEVLENEAPKSKIEEVD